MAKAIDGVEIKVDNTKLFDERFRTAILSALETIGVEAENAASKNAPKRTGFLRDHISHAVDAGGLYAVIGTNVPYAPYQELGTSRYDGANGGRGFLRPAANDNQKRWGEIMKKRLEQG